jgi:hypothetical protein
VAFGHAYHGERARQFGDLLDVVKVAERQRQWESPREVLGGRVADQLRAELLAGNGEADGCHAGLLGR